MIIALVQFALPQPMTVAQARDMFNSTAPRYLGLPGLVRDVGLVLVTLASLALTPRAVHEANQFNWGPMLEVAKLFAGIFITIIPVIAMLKAGVDGPFGAVVRADLRADCA